MMLFAKWCWNKMSEQAQIVALIFGVIIGQVAFGYFLIWLHNTYYPMGCLLDMIIAFGFCVVAPAVYIKRLYSQYLSEQPGKPKHKAKRDLSVRYNGETTWVNSCDLKNAMADVIDDDAHISEYFYDAEGDGE